jgi:ADP-heptose:LPS heptosyltransferase
MKILLLRFSSFGDVLQTLSVAGKLGAAFPQSEIHWVTREEFAPLIETHPCVKKVWTLRRGAGFSDLLALGRSLKAEGFTHVYDAHNNLRSRVLCWQLKGWANWRVWLRRVKFVRRSIYRFRRFLLFNWHINLFPKPFPGQFALLEPLRRWGLTPELPPVPQLFLSVSQGASKKIPWKDFVALAPSASYPLKRWPIEHWAKLIQLMAKTQFVVLGGPDDAFLQALVDVAPERVRNFAGQLSLYESAQWIAQAAALVSNDTGLLHVAEQIGKPCIALMGPAPFGYPGRPATRILELELSCRPCSKHGQGPCVNAKFQKCLRDITPEQVAAQLVIQLGSQIHARVASSLPLSK